MFCGIDPGLSGAICFMSDKTIVLNKMPTMKDPKSKSKRLYDLVSIKNLLQNPSIDLVTIEKSLPLPGMGVLTPYLTGYCQGVLEALCVALQIRYQVVHPRSWQNAFFKDISKKDTKAASILIAKRLFPQVNLIPDNCKKPHDGFADALLICEYGKRLYKNFADSQQEG